MRQLLDVQSNNDAQALDLTTVLVGIFMYLVRADGVICPSEEYVVREFFRDQLRYGSHEMASVEREIELKSTAEIDVASKAQFLLQMPEVVRELTLDACVKIVLADGTVDKGERDALVFVAKLLKVDEHYLRILSSRLGRWVDGKFTNRDHDLHKLGLEENSTQAEIRSRFRELQDQCQPGRVASLGEEFSRLAYQRINELTLSYERLLLDAPQEEQDSAIAADIHISKIGLSAELVAEFEKLGILSTGCLKDTGLIRRLLPVARGFERVHSLAAKCRPSSKDALKNQHPLLAKWPSSVVEIVVEFLGELIRDILDSRKVPLKVDELGSILKVRFGASSLGYLKAALELEERRGNAFNLSLGKWVTTKVLSIGSDLVQELWQLATDELGRRTGDLHCYELGWRKHLSGLVAARVDFALRDCPSVKRVKPGVYRRAEIRNQAPVRAPIGKVSNADRTKDKLAISMLQLDSSLAFRIASAGYKSVEQLFRQIPEKLLFNIPLLTVSELKKINEALLEFGDKHPELFQAVADFGDGVNRLVEFIAIQPTDSNASFLGLLLDIVGPLSLLILDDRFKFLDGVATFQSKYGPMVTVGPEQMVVIQNLSLTAVRQNTAVQEFVEVLLRDFLSAGWLLIEEYESAAVERNSSAISVSVLKFLSDCFTELTYYESLAMISIDKRRTDQLLDQKFLARDEIPAPRTISEVRAWLRAQFLDLTDLQADKVVRKLWQSTLVDNIVASYGDSSLEDIVAAVLLSGGGQLTVPEILNAPSIDSIVAPAQRDQIPTILARNPLRFAQTGEFSYALWSTLGFDENNWETILDEVEVILWSLGRTTNSLWVVAYLNRHSYDIGEWLNSYSLQSILRRIKGRIECIGDGYLRPVGSSYPEIDLEALVVEFVRGSDGSAELIDIENHVRQSVVFPTLTIERALSACVQKGWLECKESEWRAAS